MAGWHSIGHALKKIGHQYDKISNKVNTAVGDAFTGGSITNAKIAKQAREDAENAAKAEREATEKNIADAKAQSDAEDSYNANISNLQSSISQGQSQDLNDFASSLSDEDDEDALMQSFRR